MIALAGSAAAGVVAGWRPAWVAAFWTGALALEALLLAGAAATVAAAAGGAFGGLVRALALRRLGAAEAA